MFLSAPPDTNNALSCEITEFTRIGVNKQNEHNEKQSFFWIIKRLGFWTALLYNMQLPVTFSQNNQGKINGRNSLAIYTKIYIIYIKSMCTSSILTDEISIDTTGNLCPYNERKN